MLGLIDYSLCVTVEERGTKTFEFSTLWTQKNFFPAGLGCVLGKKHR